MEDWWNTLTATVAELESAQIACCIVDEAALIVHGVKLPALPPLTIAVQWDQFAAAHALYQPLGASPIAASGASAQFQFSRSGWPVAITCQRNTVVEADPERVIVVREQQPLPIKTLLFYRHAWGQADLRVALIEARLRELQAELTAHNAAAWSHAATYLAWVERHGPPAEAAARLVADPASRLGALQRHLGPLEGRRIINLMGSNGSKAVALALLGGKVTLVDIAPENLRYASELAVAASATLRCIGADVLALPAAERTADYDLVLLELGILHYFIDLLPLAVVVTELLGAGGRLVLQDFHPVSTKLISSKGRKHKVSGNYFDPTLHSTPVAYSKHLSLDKHLSDAQPQPQVQLRRWTLGEIVTAFAAAGLRIAGLFEEPNTKLDDAGIPKTFTLVAEKP
ncbi:MAG: methyltransferase domain-containing protein [Herpetosiphonaceae bacterium]|nr:methyltransferase domain-containing protein [Herpetosiphonaceae bacterium]